MSGGQVVLSADQWADRIRGHLQQTAESLIAAGVDLLAAKEQVAHGEWLPLLERVGIAKSTARKLMAVGRHAESFRGNDLPATVGALYELSHLDPPQLEAAIADGRVHADMTRADVHALRPGSADTRANEACELYWQLSDAGLDPVHVVGWWRDVEDIKTTCGFQAAAMHVLGAGAAIEEEPGRGPNQRERRGVRLTAYWFIPMNWLTVEYWRAGRDPYCYPLEHHFREHAELFMEMLAAEAGAS